MTCWLCELLRPSEERHNRLGAVGAELTLARRGSSRTLCRHRHLMTDPENVIDALGINRALVLRFFATFSRFEYSLKRSGFLKTGDKAEANWDAYANSLRGQFANVQDSAFRDAVAFFLNAPPGTQVVSGSDIDWRDTKLGNGEQHENYILRLVKIVRNNLFHGGKYPVPTGPMEEVGRNQRLLEASITVLKQCLELSNDVRRAFEETA